MENIKYETGNSGTLIPFKGKIPKLHPSVFTCDGVKIIGDVEIEKNCSIWFNSVVRGDVHYIRIGENSNIQDMCMLHVTNNKYPLIIGKNVSIAHSVTLHGATLKDNCLIGIGAKILDNSVVESNTLVAAGSVVRENWTVPQGTLVAGVPAKVIRDLTDAEIQRVSETAPNYIKYAQDYRNQIG